MLILFCQNLLQNEIFTFDETHNLLVQIFEINHYRDKFKKFSIYFMQNFRSSFFFDFSKIVIFRRFSTTLNLIVIIHFFVNVSICFKTFFFHDLYDVVILTLIFLY